MTTYEQGELFAVPGRIPPESAEKRKARGLELALQGCATKYQRAFLTALFRRAMSGRPFTAEDVTFDVGLPNASAPNSNNSVGALVNQAARLGWIRKTGRWVKAASENANGREVREWVGDLGGGAA